MIKTDEIRATILGGTATLIEKAHLARQLDAIARSLGIPTIRNCRNIAPETITYLLRSGETVKAKQLIEIKRLHSLALHTPKNLSSTASRAALTLRFASLSMASRKAFDELLEEMQLSVSISRISPAGRKPHDRLSVFKAGSPVKTADYATALLASLATITHKHDGEN